MSALGVVRTWVRSVLMRRRIEREMQEEMNAHIEQAAERFRARGMSERDALQGARREFGNTTLIQENARDSRGGRWVDNLLTDVRYALRYFARTPLSTVTIVLTLTLGVGVNTAAYTVYQGVMTRPPLGIPDDPSLVVIRGLQSGTTDGRPRIDGRNFSLDELRQYASNSAFSTVAGHSTRNVRLDAASDNPTEGTGAQLSLILYVTPNYFQTLGIALESGAGFINKSFDSNDVELSAILGFSLAVERFGSAESAVGKTISANGRLLTVVGVAQPSFGGVHQGNARRVWVPLSAYAAIAENPGATFNNDSAYFEAVARLADESSVEAATQSVAAIAQRFTSTDAVYKDYKNDGSEVVPLRGEIRVQSRSQRQENLMGALALTALDLVILLVCTTTVSSLLIGAAVKRRHEIGVRLAMGASRARIVRQLLTESVLLALAGGLGGILVCELAIKAAGTQLIEFNASPTLGTYAFTLAFSLFTAALAGLTPALHATRLGLSSTLKDSGANLTSRTRLQRTFVTAQIALAQPLLVCLVMFAVFVWQQSSRTSSERALENQLIVASFEGGFAQRKDATDQTIGDVRERLKGMPGIVGVAYRSEGGLTSPIDLPKGAAIAEQERARDVVVTSRTVPADFFKLMDMSIVAGTIPSDFVRDATVSTEGEKTVIRPRSRELQAVVSQAFAQKVFAGQNPIGRKFCFDACSKQRGTYTIVAVADDKGTQSRASRQTGSLQIFTPMWNTTYAHALLIRTEGDAERMLPMVQTVARSVAPRLPILKLKTVAQENAEEMLLMRQVAGATAGGGLITLLLGCVGLYAVVSLAVGQRRREIGVRIAMGAQPEQVVRMFFRSGVVLCSIGLAIGLPLSAVVLRVLSTGVGFPRTNTVAIVSFIACTVLAVASLATWIPSRRAASVDPLVALRAE